LILIVHNNFHACSRSGPESPKFPRRLPLKKRNIVAVWSFSPLGALFAELSDWRSELRWCGAGEARTVPAALYFPVERNCGLVGAPRRFVGRRLEFHAQ
jgi:hypothetical protein